MAAAIIQEDLIQGMRGRVNRDGRQFTRSIIVGGLTGTDTTTYFTTAFTTGATNIGDAWPDSPVDPTTGVNVYCTGIEYAPLNADKCQITYTYDSYPSDVQVDIGTVEMQEETCYDGTGTLITTTYNGATVPMKVTRVFCNVERVLRWSGHYTYAQIAALFSYRDCTDASRVWLCRSVNAQNADNNPDGGLWLIQVRLEAKSDTWRQVTWLEDDDGYIIDSTITVVYPYPTTTFPSGWF